MSDLDEIVKTIEWKFAFLFEKGFMVSNKAFYENEFGNWIVSLDSTMFKIRLRQDKNDIFISFGPIWASSEIRDFKHFFDLEVILAYLTGEKNYYPIASKGGKTEAVLEDLSRLTRLHLQEIARLFEPDRFVEKEEELHKLGKELFGQFIDSLRRKNPTSQGKS
jgi:hypothetical protein